MIILTCHSTGEVYNVFTRPIHLVGRPSAINTSDKRNHLDLENDKSISRCHAKISISIKNGNPVMTVEDMKSKYGTYVNGAKINEKTVVKIGDHIRFGIQKHVWTVCKGKIIVCPSLLSHAEKTVLENELKFFNGTLISNWSPDCTHVTCKTIEITIKIASALASAKPLVSLQYWQQLKKVYESEAEIPLPDCDDFLPAPNEPKLGLDRKAFGITYARKKLFKNRIFVACGVTQFEQLKPLVEAAGGIVFNGSLEKVTREAGKIMLIMKDTDENSLKLKKMNPWIRSYLKEGFFRVSISDVGFAIATTSVQKYCNPKSEISDSSTSSMNDSVLLADSQASISRSMESIVFASANMENYANPTCTMESTMIEYSENTKLEKGEGSALKTNFWPSAKRSLNFDESFEEVKAAPKPETFAKRSLDEKTNENEEKAKKSRKSLPLPPPLSPEPEPAENPLKREKEPIRDFPDDEEIFGSLPIEKRFNQSPENPNAKRLCRDLSLVLLPNRKPSSRTTPEINNEESEMEGSGVECPPKAKVNANEKFPVEKRGSKCDEKYNHMNIITKSMVRSMKIEPSPVETSSNKVNFKRFRKTSSRHSFPKKNIPMDKIKILAPSTPSEKEE